MASALLYFRYQMRISLQCCPLSHALGSLVSSTPQSRVDSVERRNNAIIFPLGLSAISLFAAVCRPGLA